MLRDTMGRLFTSAVLAGAMIPGNALAAPAGAVYTMMNAAGANAIAAFDRNADGTLGPPRTFPTGGAGLGAGLGSQGSIALSEDGHWLLAVNAGSNDITVFSVQDSGLTWRSKTPSRGVMPVSLTLHGDLVFVLNAAGTANIAGFRLEVSGALAPVSGLTRSVAGAGPAEVSFDDHGTLLAVTDKTSNTIEVFRLEDDALSAPVVTASAGAEPFGFAFGHGDVLLVSEAAGGAPGASSVSSYRVDEDGRLALISARVATTQTAACWLAVTNSGKEAFTGNTGSASISTLAVRSDGSVSLEQGAAGHTPSGTSPTDVALTVNSRFLYNLASGTISGFAVGPGGSLLPVAAASGLPASTVGLAAR